MRERTDIPLRTLLLAGLETCYAWGLSLHSRRVAARLRGGAWVRRLPRPVVSVGNIVAGGVGKTPLVEALAREWLRRGGCPAILSRGYRGGPDGNDEFQVLRRRLPGVPHRQDPDRYRAGSSLLAERPEVDLFLLDDGFQHRRLHRDLDLVVLDATRPFGFGHLLPRGLLREPWTALARADALVLTRLQEASGHKVVILRAFLEERFRLPIFSITSRHEDARDPRGKSIDLSPVGRYGAFCGIGNPEAFFHSLRQLGIQVRAQRSWPDHHAYRPRDLRDLMTWGRAHDTEALLCTEKDGVKLEKLPGFADARPPIYQVRIVFDLPEPNPLDLLPTSA